MRTMVDAYVRVVARADGAARTVLEEIRCDGALAVRRTGGREAPTTVHLVGAAGGPLGGDRWRIELVVGAGAHLRVRSAAATLALPGRDGGQSLLEVHARVAAGGLLDFAPEPLVVAAGARHSNRVRVTLDGGAGLLWREEIMCGREGEMPGDLTARLDVVHDRKPLLAQELRLGPEAVGWTSAAVLGGARAMGSVVFAGPPRHNAPAPGPITGSPTVSAAVAELAGPGVLVTAVSSDIVALRGLLDAVISHAADKTDEQVNSP
jgi:urease accessory protein